MKYQPLQALRYGKGVMGKNLIACGELRKGGQEHFLEIVRRLEEPYPGGVFLKDSLVGTLWGLGAERWHLRYRSAAEEAGYMERKGDLLCPPPRGAGNRAMRRLANLCGCVLCEDEVALR